MKEMVWPFGKKRKQTKKKSADRLEQIIDDMLANGDINNGAIPDMLERQVYRKVLETLRGVMDEMLANTSFQVLDRRIRFVVDELPPVPGNTEAFTL